MKILTWLKKYVWLILAFICVLSIAYLAGRCSTKKDNAVVLSNLIASRDSTHAYSVVIDGLQNTVTEKNALILTKEEAIKIGLLENERLKKLHIKDVITNVELQATIKVKDSLLLLQPNTIFRTIKDTSGVTHDYVRIPFTLLDVRSTYVSLLAGMDKNRQAWFDLDMPLSGEMTIAHQKIGFLRTKPIGVFTTLNPYLAVNNMDIVIIQEPKRFFQKAWFNIGIGALGMELINIFVK